MTPPDVRFPKINGSAQLRNIHGTCRQPYLYLRMRKTKSSKVNPFAQGHTFVSSRGLNLNLVSNSLSTIVARTAHRSHPVYLPGPTGSDSLELYVAVGLRPRPGPARESAVSHQSSRPLAGVKGVMLTSYPGLLLNHLHGETYIRTKPKHETTAIMLHRISLNYLIQSSHTVGYVNPNESFILFVWH